MALDGETSDESGDLARRVVKLERINAALMAHVERTMDQQGGAYALFQTAIMLEGRVRSRTEELTSLMKSLETSNTALQAAKDEAETANRSKTRSLAAASHDLLQPLNAARLSLSALADLAPGHEAQTIAGQVERGLQTIEDLIKALIDISKLDAGAVRPVIKPVRLADLVAHIESSFRPFAERKGLRLLVRAGDVVVATDLVLMQRILQNLVSNAVRYTESGGVLIGVRRRGGQCRIDVIDTGRGIPEEERALGHPVQLHSRVGRGTRMSVEIPLAGTAPDVLVHPTPVATTLTGARVLVIENDASTAEALERLLRGWDAEVESHRALAGVMDSLRAGMPRPDVMIIDFHLSDGACGLDVVDHLRQARGWITPVIVTTADYGVEVGRRVVEAQAELMLKPVKPAQLRALLSYLLA